MYRNNIVIAPCFLLVNTHLFCRSYNIFDDAMKTVLDMMETNFSAAFQKTEAYKELERKALQEADELERLRKVRCS